MCFIQLLQSVYSALYIHSIELTHLLPSRELSESENIWEIRRLQLHFWTHSSLVGLQRTMMVLHVCLEK